MKNLQATASLTLALLALAGCGGNSQAGAAGDVSTGIATSKALSAVSAEEASQGCEHMKAAVETRFQKPSAKTGMCTFFALTLSSTESTCTSLRDSCLKGDTGTGSDAHAVSLTDPAQGFECSGTNVDGWQGCTATVGQMETCLNDMLDALDATLSAYTCKDAAEPQVESSADCTPPPLDPSGNIAIDPVTNKPYIDHSAECRAAQAEPMSPLTPKSCQALQTQCPGLEMFGQ